MDFTIKQVKLIKVYIRLRVMGVTDLVPIFLNLGFLN